MRKLILMVGILLATFTPAMGQYEDPEDIPKNLHTSFLKPGVQLELTEDGSGFPIQAFELLRLKANGVSTPIHDIGDLQGAVIIDSPQKALDYVRLITSYSTYYFALWHRKLFVEVIDRQRAKRLSTYGLSNEPLWQQRSGCMGILSETAAKRSGLSMAHVKPVQNGFIITRWLYKHTSTATEYSDTLIFVEETVNRDGTYRQRILKQKPAPKLPGTFWLILTFE